MPGFSPCPCYIFHMTIERTIGILPSGRPEMDLPFDLPVGRAKMAITITPEAERKTAFGYLREFANPSKIPGEKGAWARAAIERHAKKLTPIFSLNVFTTGIDAEATDHAMGPGIPMVQLPTRRLGADTEEGLPGVSS